MSTSESGYYLNRFECLAVSARNDPLPSPAAPVFRSVVTAYQILTPPLYPLTQLCLLPCALPSCRHSTALLYIESSQLLPGHILISLVLVSTPFRSSSRSLTRCAISPRRYFYNASFLNRTITCIWVAGETTISEVSVRRSRRDGDISLPRRFADQSGPHRRNNLLRSLLI